MSIGTIIIVNDIIGFYVGTEGLHTKIQCADGVVRNVIIGDDLKNHEICNPYALAKIYYDKLVAKVMEERNKQSTPTA